MSDSRSTAHPDQEESAGGAAVEVGTGLPEFLTQDYSQYTQEDHDTWKHVVLASHGRAEGQRQRRST